LHNKLKTQLKQKWGVSHTYVGSYVKLCFQTLQISI